MSDQPSLKDQFKYCFSVAYRNSSYFRSHAHKVKDDAAFIKKAFESNDIETLKFMESFYIELQKDQKCRVCIMSKFSGSIQPLDNAEKKTKRKNVRLEE